MYTSRSPVESYQDCNRYRYNQYLYPIEGKNVGIVPIQKAVPLVTGSAVHRGIEHLLNRVRINEEPSVDVAVGLAVEQYEKDCEKLGFRGKGLENDRQQWFTFNEQRALVEALIRTWFIVELPNIAARYTVLFVERDINPIEISPGVWFQAKVDAEFKEKASGDFHNYSLKTMKAWNERAENSYKSDLQGITEIWAVEEDARQQARIINALVKGLEKLDKFNVIPQNDLVKIAAFISKKKQEKKVMGVRFCILIKGVRKLNKYSELYVTYSPLIRGYKNVTPSGIAYAHSWTYPNEANKSGESILGKGWEPFNVWESDISIKDWINMLASNTIQPSCGDVLRGNVVTPTEYFRSELEQKVAMEEVKLQEEKILIGLDQINKNLDQPMVLEHLMASYFPHNRKTCDFHYGEVCEYKELCWNPNIASDPIGSELYQIREPHHIFEKG